MPLYRFLEWYPRYRQAFSDPVYEELYQFLSSPERIWSMAQASEVGKPALNGVVKELEWKFEDRLDFDNPVNRRMIGSMIKEILYDFGFRRKGQRMVSNSKYFATASYYQLEEGKAKKKVSGLFEVRETKTEESNTKQEYIVSPGSGETCRQDKQADHRQYDCIEETEEELENLVRIVEDNSSSYCEKREALKKLGKIDTAALSSVSAMRNALQDNYLARTTAEILTQMASSACKVGGAANIAQEFIWMLQDEKSERRLMAAEALGRIGAPGASDAVGALAEALRDENEEVREASAWALYEIGHPAFKTASSSLVEALEDESEEVRIAATRALGICVPTSVNLLVGLLEHENPHVRKRAAFELGRAEKFAEVDAAEGLCRALSSSDDELRVYAAWALGKIGETAEGAVEALFEALKDEKKSVREKAAWAVGQIGAKIKYFDSSVLYEALADESKNVRKAAAWAMGNILSHKNDPTSRLMELIWDENKQVREKAVWALGRICANSSKAKPAVPILIESLSDEDWAVRKAAAQSLGRIGFYASRALPVLSSLKGDKEEKDIVKHMAGWAVQEISKFTDRK